MLHRILLLSLLATPAAAFEVTVQNVSGNNMTKVSAFEIKGGTVIDKKLGGYEKLIAPGRSASFDLDVPECTKVVFFYGFIDGSEAEASADLCQTTSFKLSP